MDYSLLLAILGVVIFAVHLYLRRQTHKEEIELKKKEHELHKKEFEDKQKDREDNREWLYRQNLHLNEVSNLIADKVTAELCRDVRWACEALEKAKLNPHDQTLFGDRLGHFRNEKEHIANHFLPVLINRCKYHINSGKAVYLLVDSGTTLYPLFEMFGKETVRLHEDKENWINNLFLYTNNLPGIESLIEKGRINPNNRYSQLAIESFLLPGVPVPVYSAVLGDKTNDALIQLRNEVGSNAVFIALVTGNWIRLRRSIPNCPIPLARGFGHKKFKQTLIDNSDEIYVITPLGKIFIEVPPKDVNVALGYDKSHLNPDKKPYEELDISDETAKCVKLVSTSRVQGRMLSELSTRVKTLLSVDDIDSNQLSNNSINMSHILFPFDNIPTENRYLQLETEFPHDNTRTEDVMTKFFFVPPMSRHND